MHPKCNLLPLTEEVLAIFKSAVWASVNSDPKSKKTYKGDLMVNCFFVSAVAEDSKTNGLKELRDFLHEASSPGEWDEVDDDYEEESLSKASSSAVYDSVNCELDDKAFASEVIREKIFTFVHKEVPYGVNQVNRVWEYDGSKLIIQSDLIVRTRTQKKMVIGPKGDILKLIAQSAEVLN